MQDQIKKVFKIFAPDATLSFHIYNAKKQSPYVRAKYRFGESKGKYIRVAKEKDYERFRKDEKNSNLNDINVIEDGVTEFNFFIEENDAIAAFPITPEFKKAVESDPKLKEEITCAMKKTIEKIMQDHLTPEKT